MIDISEHTFNKEVIDASGKVVVYVGAPWCGNCARVKPLVLDAEARFQNIKFCYLDASNCISLATDKLNVLHLPQLILFENGVEVRRSAEDLLDTLGD